MVNVTWAAKASGEGAVAVSYLKSGQQPGVWPSPTVGQRPVGIDADKKASLVAFAQDIGMSAEQQAFYRSLTVA